jgi:hypothetical protein
MASDSRSQRGVYSATKFQGGKRGTQFSFILCILTRWSGREITKIWHRNRDREERRYKKEPSQITSRKIDIHAPLLLLFKWVLLQRKKGKPECDVNRWHDGNMMGRGVKNGSCTFFFFELWEKETQDSNFGREETKVRVHLTLSVSHSFSFSSHSRHAGSTRDHYRVFFSSRYQSKKETNQTLNFPPCNPRWMQRKKEKGWGIRIKWSSTLIEGEQKRNKE